MLIKIVSTMTDETESINKYINDYISEMVFSFNDKKITEKISKYVLSNPPKYNLPETLQIVQKKKRNKVIVPDAERCMAKRATGERCTRRHKEHSQYCGTHHETRPHGEIQPDGENMALTKKLIVNAVSVDGIIYYIDDVGNVYNTVDILKDSSSPTIIGSYKRYIMDEDGNKEYLEETGEECSYEIILK
jgi:hypothetical protein